MLCIRRCDAGIVVCLLAHSFHIDVFDALGSCLILSSDLGRSIRVHMGTVLYLEQIARGRSLRFAGTALFLQRRV